MTRVSGLWLNPSRGDLLGGSNTKCTRYPKVNAFFRPLTTLKGMDALAVFIKPTRRVS
jgi:hypothetical protein